MSGNEVCFRIRYDIYPLTIVEDRFGGTYSGGIYTAWNLYPYDIPHELFIGDCACSDFWHECTVPVGRGNTPDEAADDLRDRLFVEILRKQDEKFLNQDYIQLDFSEEIKKKLPKICHQWETD